MYIPGHFEEKRVDVLHELVRARPLATLVTSSPGGLDANHIPFYLASNPAPLGTLQGHIARANPLATQIGDGIEALAVFHGPEGYITPSWYATKKESGKAIPTWNYTVVHATGVLRLMDDADWLRAQLEALTRHNEAAFEQPWSPSDAPPDYIEKLMGAIVGVEMVIECLTGKWKVSQNHPAANRAGVVEGLKAQGTSVALDMAALVAGGGRGDTHAA